MRSGSTLLDRCTAATRHRGAVLPDDWHDNRTDAEADRMLQGYLRDNCGTFSASFYVIRETTSFTRFPEKGSAVARPRNKHKHSNSQASTVAHCPVEPAVSSRRTTGS